MKSWGARIVERLLNLRSRKSDSEGNETVVVVNPVEAGPMQSNNKPDEELPIKFIEKGVEKTGFEANREVEPTDRLTQGRAHKPQSGFQADKGETVSERAATDEASAMQSVNINRVRKPVARNNSRKKLSKADKTAVISTDPVNRAEEFVPVREGLASEEPSGLVELLKVEHRTAKNSPISKTSASSSKRFRKQKHKATGERVTDEELAELEAENIRLKLLLSEKLNVSS